MAVVRELVCDVEGCSVRPASSFSVFSHRQSDGAGSMEDWDFVFELCPKHSHALLQLALSVCRNHASVVPMFERLHIKTRIG